jgi:hypothetical protein
MTTIPALDRQVVPAAPGENRAGALDHLGAQWLSSS